MRISLTGIGPYKRVWLANIFMPCGYVLTRTYNVKCKTNRRIERNNDGVDKSTEYVRTGDTLKNNVLIILT